MYTSNLIFHVHVCVLTRTCTLVTGCKCHFLACVGVRNIQTNTAISRIGLLRSWAVVYMYFGVNYLSVFIFQKLF